MDTNSRNWKWARKNHLLAVVSLFLLQNHLHVSVMFVEAKSSVHIVYMGQKKHDDPETTKKSHHKMLSNFLGSKEAAKSSILYSYRHGFSGFAARFTESQAEAIADFPGVVQVIPNRIHKLHTTRSWDFIGINQHSSTNLLRKSNMGEGTIIGVIDSGVWPESECFNDEAMGPVPSRWKGICQQGERFNSTNCNKKLIGARWFVKGVRDELKMPINETGTIEFLSPRDLIGHGTHTASTAGGYFVEKANYRGLAAGLARGGAPLAHLAIYKACWSIANGGCSDADLLKAFDKAIHDGVDIISLSVGNDIPLFSYVDQRDTIAIGSFHAIAKGISVVCSAGNNGPISQTISNTAPWLITVAATTIDRAFPTAITLGNNRTIWGQSIDIGKHYPGFTGLTYSERIAVDPTDDSAKDCQLGSLNATKAAGKIILCFSKSHQQDIISASNSVLEAGGVGLIFAHFKDDGLVSCNIIPCIRVNYDVGTQILSYIRRARSPTAKLSFPRTDIGKWVSPRVATFSSRGPSSMSPAVLKPDIAAPGVDILAAYPPVHTKRSNGFALLSGTSMACPHVAGIAALIKSVHQNWSPAAIRSALVTSAYQIGTDGTSIYQDGPNSKVADAFDLGGGHVNPNKAVDPGLIYNISTDDYVQFLCSLGYSSASITSLTKTTIDCVEKSHFELNLNLPSITIPNLKETVTVTRTVTNVGHFTSVYKVIVEAPYGIQMTVKPQTLSFNSTTEVLSFQVTFSSTQKLYGDYKFGSLTWTDGKHLVRIPIAVLPSNLDHIYGNVEDGWKVIQSNDYL
ncbi:subtilisin-like protease SBT3.9 [Corylus avellana]|uniref:subtilisin-like protease SBT3.9 n=1 Tax=Corylus avellana TaxID=13451 RepID=UPI00286AF56A|nr:subtilisin-like protease SBT3.9 [Corylus avellana]